MLTLSVLGSSPEKGTVRRRRSRARRGGRRRKRWLGWRRRTSASRANSFCVEAQHGEAVKMASSICSGVASVTGDLKGTAAAMVDMELDLGFGVSVRGENE